MPPNIEERRVQYRQEGPPHRSLEKRLATCEFDKMFNRKAILLALVASVVAIEQFKGNGHKKRQGLPNATWGPYVDLGFTKGEYTKLTTVFTAGKPPPIPGYRGTIFLWPGLWDRKDQNKADLIQTVAEYHSPSAMKSTCNAQPGQWCIRPFVVNYTAKPISQFPQLGKAIDANDKILIEYIKAPGPGGNWTQKLTNLSKNNQVLFSWQRGSKSANWMRLATEYQGGNTAGTVDTQHYWNTTVTVSQPEPGLGATFRVTGNIVATKPHTSDGGKKWTIDHVSIPAKSQAQKTELKGTF